MGRLVTPLSIPGTAAGATRTWPAYAESSIVALALAVPVAEQWVAEALGVRNLVTTIVNPAGTPDYDTAQLLVYLSGIQLASVPLFLTNASGPNGNPVMQGGMNLPSPIELDAKEQLQVQLIMRGDSLTPGQLNIRILDVTAIANPDYNQFTIFGSRTPLPGIAHRP